MESISNDDHRAIFNVLKALIIENAAADSLINRLSNIYIKIDSLLTSANIDNGHGIDHAMIVMNHVITAIICNNNKCFLKPKKGKYIYLKDIYPLCAAALLHDVDDHKFFPENSNNAEKISKEFSTDDEHDLIMEYINLVSYSKNGNVQDKSDELFYYVRWADRLEANGKIGYERCIEYSTFSERPFMTDISPIMRNARDIELVGEKRNKQYVANGYKSIDNSSIGHIYDKVLDLKNIKSTNDYFNNEMQRRHLYIIGKLLDVAFSFDMRLKRRLSNLDENTFNNVRNFWLAIEGRFSFPEIISVSKNCATMQWIKTSLFLIFTEDGLNVDVHDIDRNENFIFSTKKSDDALSKMKRIVSK